MNKPKIVILVQGDLYKKIFPPPVRADLESFAEVVSREQGQGWPEPLLCQTLADADACLTSWGAPVFNDAVLAAAPRLKVIAHTAGSIRGFAGDNVFRRGIHVTHAARAIAKSVGEMSLALTLAMLRSLPQHDRAIRGSDAWLTPLPNQGLFGQRIGLIGFGHAAQYFMRLLEPFHAAIKVYSPHASPALVDTLGGKATTLEDLLSTSSIVSLHYALTDESKHLLNASRLALIPGGGIIINTSRGGLIDTAALVKELESGRLRAALDVTDPEPLPAGHILRKLSNVLIVPHRAGPTDERFGEQGQMAVDELRRFFAGQSMWFELDERKCKVA
jgi:phosphoglycerate dehydrogenase-like enzyme